MMFPGGNVEEEEKTGAEEEEERSPPLPHMFSPRKLLGNLVRMSVPDLRYFAEGLDLDSTGSSRVLRDRIKECLEKDGRHKTKQTKNGKSPSATSAYWWDEDDDPWDYGDDSDETYDDSEQVISSPPVAPILEVVEVQLYRSTSKYSSCL